MGKTNAETQRAYRERVAAKQAQLEQALAERDQQIAQLKRRLQMIGHYDEPDTPYPA
jgi:uncharacterized protein YceH (UPF0502 family)